MRHERARGTRGTAPNAHVVASSRRADGPVSPRHTTTGLINIPFPVSQLWSTMSARSLSTRYSFHKSRSCVFGKFQRFYHYHFPRSSIHPSRILRARCLFLLQSEKMLITMSCSTVHKTQSLLFLSPPGHYPPGLYSDSRAAYLNSLSFSDPVIMILVLPSLCVAVLMPVRLLVLYFFDQVFTPLGA
jgi:hypothetical protein